MAKLPPPDLLKALKSAREQSQGSLPSHTTQKPSKPPAQKTDGVNSPEFSRHPLSLLSSVFRIRRVTASRF